MPCLHNIMFLIIYIYFQNNKNSVLLRILKQKSHNKTLFRKKVFSPVFFFFTSVKTLTEHSELKKSFSSFQDQRLAWQAEHQCFTTLNTMNSWSDPSCCCCNRTRSGCRAPAPLTGSPRCSGCVPPGSVPPPLCLCFPVGQDVKDGDKWKRLLVGFMSRVILLIEATDLSTAVLCDAPKCAISL